MGSRSARFLAVAMLLMAPATIRCAAFSDSSSTAPAGDAGVDPAGVDIVDDAGNGPDIPVVTDPDAGLDLDGGADADASLPECLPSRVFVATPVGSTGFVCNADGALLSGGTAAGLDYPGGTLALLDNVNVTSCVAAEFAQPLHDAVLRLAAAPKACNTTCLAGNGCGTGDTAQIFWGATQGAYHYLGKANVTTAFGTAAVAMPAGQTSRYVVVCRAGFGSNRDDIVVDAIAGHCF